MPTTDHLPWPTQPVVYNNILVTFWQAWLSFSDPLHQNSGGTSCPWICSTPDGL